jgi:transposase
MIAPMVVEGAMTGEMFLAYVENGLVPMLRRNDIVVMDNCRVHLGPGIRRAIEKSGATLRYLPKYSPDLNPIEMPYSKFKTFLRKVAARTVPGLNRAIRSFIPQLSHFQSGAPEVALRQRLGHQGALDTTVGLYKSDHSRRGTESPGGRLHRIDFVGIILSCS